MSAEDAAAIRRDRVTCPECGGPKSPQARSGINCHVRHVERYTLNTSQTWPANDGASSIELLVAAPALASELLELARESAA